MRDAICDEIVKLLHEQEVAGLAKALFVGEGREIEVKEVAQGFVVALEDPVRLLLQGLPAPPRVVGRMGDVAEEAEPFDIRA